jgi:hypothetical protein
MLLEITALELLNELNSNNPLKLGPIELERKKNFAGSVLILK